jgi:hypothetical protein
MALGRASVVVFEVPADRVGAGVEAVGGQSVAEFEDQIHRGSRGRIRLRPGLP